MLLEYGARPAHSQSVLPGRNSVPVWCFFVHLYILRRLVGLSLRWTDPHICRGVRPLIAVEGEMRRRRREKASSPQRLNFKALREGVMGAARWVGAGRDDATAPRPHQLALSLPRLWIS